MPLTRITKFDGAYRFLSNFYPSPIVRQNIVYPTVEHAYQASKTLDDLDRLCIARCGTPGKAKSIGKYVVLRDDWDGVRLQIMEELLLTKFVDDTLRAKLLMTDKAELIEGNEWGDRFWGVCNGKGENHLGKLLMKVRTHYA